MTVSVTLLNVTGQKETPERPPDSCKYNEDHLAKYFETLALVGYQNKMREIQPRAQ